MKRLRLHLTLDGHDVADLAAKLDSIATNVAVRGARGQEVADITSGDYHLDIVRCSDLTPEEYDEALLAWRDRRRDERHQAEPLMT